MAFRDELTLSGTSKHFNSTRRKISAPPGRVKWHIKPVFAGWSGIGAFPLTRKEGLDSVLKNLDVPHGSASGQSAPSTWCGEPPRPRMFVVPASGYRRASFSGFHSHNEHTGSKGDPCKHGLAPLLVSFYERSM